MSVGRLAAVLLVLAVSVALIVGARRDDPQPCTWGASSVGPVTIVGGTVAGSTTPHATGCRP